MGYKGLGNSRELFDRKNAVVLLVCNDVPNDLVGNNLLVIGKPINEGRIAQDIDHARDSTACRRNQCTRLLGKEGAIGSYCFETKSDVVGNLLEIE